MPALASPGAPRAKQPGAEGGRLVARVRSHIQRHLNRLYLSKLQQRAPSAVCVCTAHRDQQPAAVELLEEPEVRPPVVVLSAMAG